MSHNFDTCPLRFYSLLIIDSKTQKIILATKEICTLLGYLPFQLIGHHLAILNLQPLGEQLYATRHECSQSRILLQVCIHKEKSLGLDYWCFHPTSTSLLPIVNSNMTVLRLDPYGCIEYTSLANQNILLGKSLKTLIHNDDRKRLSDGLNERQTTYQVLHLRCQQLIDNDDAYEWISLTMITVPRRRSYGAQHEDMTRQLMIIRPASNPDLLTSTVARTTNQDRSTFITWSHGCLEVMRFVFGFWIGLVVEAWWTMCDTVYQGQRYLVEFLAHLLISLLDFLADCIDPAPSSTSSVRVVQAQEKWREPKLQQLDDNNTTEVPWVRPLHRKRWATAVRTLRKRVQSSTVAQKSLGVLESIGVVQSATMFDYLEKVTSEHYYHSSRPSPPPPTIKDKTI
ncbi:uncharacterized protein BX664DRAFT_196449 [Halteromyces radiatus]|uniref:uncharacterized protein n=1 Tax=Halteromyces radiatus TaxID=101107 RepID=UPI00221FB08F|nr:uncharacterized protein BX664DRAFT_196449 [Halteromyces radiatus]KAI8081575.1 hypothetical protein BX664DRAFT_196449 [Halteromyces radiatus]